MKYRKNNKIECIDCYVLGNILISGNIKVSTGRLAALFNNEKTKAKSNRR